MTNTRLELCNMIRMEAEHTEDTGFPLEVFPQTVQSVILDMARYENYKTEFIATAMISAVSAALGGICGIGRRLPYPHQRRMAEQCRPLHHPRGQAGTGQDTANRIKTIRSCLY